MHGVLILINSVLLLQKYIMTGAGHTKRLVELYKRRSKVEVLTAELNEGAAGGQRDRQGMRLRTRQAIDKTGTQLYIHVARQETM